MRRAARIDTNQHPIVAALQSCGCTVTSLARMSDGVPDLLVARAGAWYLLEIKTDAGVQTSAQIEWAKNQNAPVKIVRNVDEAMQAVGLKKVSVLLAKQP